VGKGKALEMITTAGMLSAAEAKEWGLVNHVCLQKDLIPMAEKLALKIKRNSPMAIAKAIKSINAGFVDGVNGFEVEISEFGSCFETLEFVEGTTAFMEKRKPNF
jgi:enoyl-CoA hydratase